MEDNIAAFSQVRRFLSKRICRVEFRANARLEHYKGHAVYHIQQTSQYQVPTHYLFIVFKAVYDTIDRAVLWKIMDENGFTRKILYGQRKSRKLTLPKVPEPTEN